MRPRGTPSPRPRVTPSPSRPLAWLAFLAAAATALAAPPFASARRATAPQPRPVATPPDRSVEPKKPGVDGVDGRRTRPVREPAPSESQDARIVAELAALDRAALKDDDWAKEWAGEYFTGDGLATNIEIKLAPKSGITYTWRGCLGLYDGNRGDVAEAFPGGLKLRLAIPPDAGISRFMSETLYFVPWGDRRYLVPQTQMLKLVNNYNEGGHAREKMRGIPLRVEGGDPRNIPETTPPGRPRLPPEYARLIVEKPLSLRVTKASALPQQNVTRGVDVRETKLELDGGLNQGVYVGMEFTYRRGQWFGTVRIDRVEETTSAATCTIFSGSDDNVETPTAATTFTFPGADPEPALPAVEPRK
jgi:hypothetical protein